jgi:multiple sugar transport system substrate-binding protein
MKHISRRDFLKYAAMASGGAVLAACATPAQPTPEKIVETVEVMVKETVIVEATLEPTQVPPVTKVEGTVVVMHGRGELTEDQQKQFEADNPGIKIEFVNTDDDRRTAMMAAGTAPDMFRSVAGMVPGYLIRGLVYDLTPYFQASSLLKVEDLAPANAAYYAQDALHVGSGNIYGMVKDWSALLSAYINTAMFEEAGIPIPEDVTPLTYAEIGEMARKMTKKEGDRVLQRGFGGGSIDWTMDSDAASHVAETAGVEPNPYVGVLYNDLFNKINLTANEPIKAALKYFFDMALEGVTSSPINPSSAWEGQDFVDGKVAIVNEGYWFGAMAESDTTRGKVKPLVAPRWSTDGKRLNQPSATGAMIYSGTKLPDATWRVFEWYNGEAPALDRAKTGWGIPGLISMYPLLPQDPPFNQARYKVLQDDLKNTDCASPFPVCPWGGVGFNPIWNKYIEGALRGETTFDEALANMEKEVNDTLGQQFKKYGS